MKKRKLLFAVMIVFLLSTFNMAAFAEDEDLNGYSANDIAAVNNIIENNGLKGYEKNAPEAWSAGGLVFWNRGSDGKQYVQNLNLEKKQLSGTLDVSGMSELKYLKCGDNDLTGLNVSGLTNIKTLRCANNKLTSLDVSNLSTLETLQCYNNLLSTIDLTGLIKLEDFRCHSNSSLKEIKGLSDCKDLTLLLCAECNLQGSLDVTELTKLNRLACFDNNITNIIGLTNKADMERLEVYTNNLRRLDVSGCKKLEILWCNNNELSIIKGLTDCKVLKKFAGDRNNLIALDLSGVPDTCELIYYNNRGFKENNCFTEVSLKNGILKIENSVGGKGYISEIMLADNKVSLATKPDTGYVFEGWYTDASLTKESKINFDGSVSKNTTLYPKFSKTISSEISLTAPVKNAVPQTNIETDEYTATVVWSPEVISTFARSTNYTATITIMPKANYTTNGITQNGYTVSGATTVENDENSNVVTAVFPRTAGSSSGGTTRYTISFDTNGGSKLSNQTVTRNSVIKEPTTPTKDGFEFAGWYTDKELKTKYDFTSKVTKSITLYAKWTKNETDPSSKPADPEWKNPFTDVKENDWFFDNVKYANQNGLMSGVTNATFAPNNSLTRAMLVTVLWRAEGKPAVDFAMPFTDVVNNAYYAEAIRWAASENIVNGITETEFAPDMNITREQIATIVYRYAKYKGYDVSVGEDTNILSYADFDEISEYAISAMQYAVGSGLMKGKTETALNPKDNATRAEIAAILNRFIEGNK